jgi:two-component system, chemotaxis family, protein-glutamate methylesterase/glutaminase
VLSGVLDDGSAGVLAIKSRGGVTIAQDPATALYSGMPQSAIETGKIDHVAPVAEMMPLLLRLVQEDIQVEENPVKDNRDVSELDNNGHQLHEPGGTPAVYSCPDCGGVLMEYQDGDFLRFRCHVGHAYSAESLVAKQSEALEDALWMALRALEENAELSRRLANRAEQNGHDSTRKYFQEKVKDTEERAATLRQILLKNEFYVHTDK